MTDEERNEANGEEQEERQDEEQLPPPATWAARHASEDEADEADEQVGAGITDEFSLDDEISEEPSQEDDEPGAPDEEPGEPAPPPVKEPPETEPPPPVEEPHAPGAPPSGEVEERPEEPTDEPAADPAAPGREAEEPDGSDVTEGDDSGEEAGEAGDAAGSDVEPEVVVKQPPPVIVEPVAAEGDEDDGKPPRAGLWPRFIAASFVIVLSMATATAASLLLYLNDIAEAIGAKLPGVEGVLKEVEGGEPQTVLILGSDIRPEIEEKGRSDTTMLLRLDADKNVLSLLSLPRDLKVNIPGYGIARLNEAYTVGGPKKTLETVKNLTGLEINHVVNIDFAGFAEAVNAIECVFVDVDRDYFHSNEGLAADQLYAEIDIDAGYQQLCGKKALDYVRYRHDDNDLVRAARQQSFLREARQKVPPERLFTKRNEFIDIFTKYTTSDINDPIAMLDVLKLFVELRDAPVRRIEFQGDIGGPDSAYVTASDEQIKTAVQQFLGKQPAPAEKVAPSGDDGAGGGDRGDGGGGGSGDGGGGDGGGEGGGGPPMIDASGAAENYALQFDGKLRFPVIAPVQLVPGSSYSDDSRAYTIDTYDGEHYPSYKMVFSLQSDFGVPEYYGVMGTKWLRAPILDNPSETRRIGDREYLLFYEGNQLQVVGFKTPDAAYWVSNTLTGTLTENQMLAVAESMKPFSPER